MSEAPAPAPAIMLDNVECPSNLLDQVCFTHMEVMKVMCYVNLPAYP